MAFKKRADGIYLKDLPPFRRIFPYLMHTRTESVVYFSEKIDMTNMLRYLEKLNKGKTTKAEKVTLFHMILTAICRTLKLRPELNRFVLGRRIYAHKEISISFIVKKALTEEAEETNARLIFRGDETIAQTRGKTFKRLAVARSNQKDDTDKLLNFVMSLPRPLINFVAWLVRKLDYHNILPAFFREAIPFYTSVYLANLGSIGLDAPYHHLFEYGTASIFMVIGKLHKEPMVNQKNRIVARDCLNISFSLDERISEGFYYARSIVLFKKLLEYPELLEKPGISAEKIFNHRGNFKTR